MATSRRDGRISKPHRMTPAERAKAICEQAGDNFREVAEAHMLSGLLVATPDLFLAARPVPSLADISDLQSPWPREECDAWFVWVGVGEWARLLEWMPFELPLIGWYRQGRGWESSHWVPLKYLRRFTSALAPPRFNCYSRVSHGRHS